ncbi:MAG: PD-(D/E)XK nuclease family protein, partial [Acidimicrobiales bacterium]
MSVSWVPYGRPVAEALRAAVADGKSDGPLAPVTVVVPSNYVGVAARRMLASGELGPVSSQGRGVAGVSFLTLHRLAELLGASKLAALGRRPVPTAVITAALRACLQAEPGVFAPVASHPATEAALLCAYKELRDVSPAALERLAAQSARASDVARLCLAAQARLQGCFYDEQDLMATAAQLVRDDASRARELGMVIVYLPQHLSAHAGVVLNEIARVLDVLVLAGTTGNERADRAVRRALERLAPDGSGQVVLHQAAAAPAPIGPSAGPGPLPARRTRIVTTSDADEEVRAAVRAVINEVLSGTPLERIAVLYASAEPYARLLAEQLDEAGIAYNGAGFASLAARAAGRTLLGLLGLATSGFRRDDVFAWLANAPLHHEGRPVPVSVWERVSREANVVAGRPQWDRLLFAYAEELRARALASEAAPNSPSWQSQRLRHDAESALRLRSFVLGLIDDLAEAASEPRGWAEHVAWAQRHLDELLGGAQQRSWWPEAEQKAAEQVERCLDRLVDLGAVEGPVPLEVFARTFQLEAASELGRARRAGEGVLVGAVRTGVGLDLDFVCVLGLAEGSFPSVVGDDSLLPDHERQAAGGELDLRSDGTERQHHELLAAMACAKRHLLCVPRGDLRRSNERAPSRWVGEIASTLAGERLSGTELLAVERPWLEHVASFYDGLRRAAFPATAQEHRLKDLLARAWHRGRPLGFVPVSDLGDPVLRGGHEDVAARRSSLFTRFDGNLGGLGVPSPANVVTSATRLESWAVCPFAYFVREVLH